MDPERATRNLASSPEAGQSTTTFRDSSDVSICEKAYEIRCWDYEPHHCTRCKSDLSVQLSHFQRQSSVMVKFKVCLLCLSFPFSGLREPHDRRASFRL